MKLEFAFHGAEIAEIKTGKTLLEIIFGAAVIMRSGVPLGTAPATLRIGTPKYSKLPKTGRLTDGELYGIPGKALNGCIPVDLRCDRECELSLSFEDKDFTIHGKSFHLTVDLTKLPTAN